MPDRTDRNIAKPQVDPTVPQHGNRVDTEGHYSGEEAGSSTPVTPDVVDAGSVAGGTPATITRGAGAGQPAEDLPPEAGHRATIDRRTGEVHGAGAGAGGGRQGENYDDSPGGDGE